SKSSPPPARNAAERGLFGDLGQHPIEELPWRDDLRAFPRDWKVFEIARHQVVCTRRLGAFQKNIVIRIETRLSHFSRSDPKSLLSDRLKSGRNDLFAALQAGTADNVFVLSVNVGAHAQLNGATQ